MIRMRDAMAADLGAIVAMLADDRLGRTREHPGDPGYAAAFAAIEADPNQRLIVAETDDAELVGCMQLTFIPGLSYRGAWRAQVEGVRVVAARRGRGIGGQMMRWAIEESRRRNCHTMQLATNKSRHDAHLFYERLGFIASHEGMKRALRDET